MKVLCMLELFNHPDNTREIPMPVVGSDYEVVNSANAHGIELYQLAGFPDDAGYVQYAFAILPDQPEEVIEELEEATA